MSNQSNEQIIHESELTRQHARYKIPAKIEIENKLYELYDWSVSGCSILDLPEKYSKKFITGEIIFVFDDFETRVKDIKLEIITKKNVEGKVAYGARFSDITPQQISILNEIITAFLSGDIITEDDIIHAVNKTQTYPKKIEPKIDKKRAWGILAIIYLTIFILVLFLVYIFYRHTFIVESANGYIDANLTVIRSPAPSYVKFSKDIKAGQDVNRSQIIAVSYLILGGVRTINSPVKGKILHLNMLDSDFRNVGEPIMTIIPKTSSIYIVGSILHKDYKKIKIGSVATVMLPDKKSFRAKIIKIRAAQTPLQSKSKILQNIYNSPRDYDIIYLKPLENILDYDKIGESVSITINTL